MNIEDIKKEAQTALSNWNGEDTGRAEEKANTAQDVLEAVKNLEELLEELRN